MGRPKKYVRPQIRRKCNHCGKMKTNPFIYHIVPEYKNIMEIPTYSRTAQKTSRIDLKGDRKIKAFHYCDRECYHKAWPDNG